MARETLATLPHYHVATFYLGGTFASKILLIMIRNLMLTGLLGLALAAASCQNGDKTTTTATSRTDSSRTVAAAPAAPKSRLSEANTGKLMELVDAYYELKDALVKTDAPRAAQTSTKLMSAAEMLDHELQADTVNYARLHPAFESIMNSSESIANTKDESCEKQRVAFEKTSTALYGLLKDAGLQNGRVYQQYCPMAFNEKGAYWLSDDREIANPYLPKKMLICGELRDSL